MILAGDSAGGNLSCGVILKAIHDNIRLPDAIILSYPATYITLSPSSARLLSLIDPMVNIGFLQLLGKTGTYLDVGDDGT